MYIHLCVNYPLFLLEILIRLEFSPTDLKKKYSNIKCRENPPRGSRVVACGLRGRTHLSKLVVAFRNFANVPKNGRFIVFNLAIPVLSTRPLKSSQLAGWQLSVSQQTSNGFLALLYSSLKCAMYRTRMNPVTRESYTTEFARVSHPVSHYSVWYFFFLSFIYTLGLI